MFVSGQFDVTLKPMESYAKAVDGSTLGRMSIDKTFSGGLSATSQGEMLSALTTIQGAAGYVAIEQVVGNLEGKKGSFILQHFGIMNGEEQRLILEVVPESGAGELEGLTGSMLIRIEDGQHFYDFEYELEC